MGDFIAAVVYALPHAQHQQLPLQQQQLQQQPVLPLQPQQLQQQPQQQPQLQPQPRQPQPRQLQPQPPQQNNVLPKEEKLVIRRELLDMTQPSCVVNPIPVSPFRLALENVQEQ